MRSSGSPWGEISQYAHADPPDRLFDGYIPLAFLALSISYFTYRLGAALAAHISRRRIALYQPVPTSDISISSKTSEGSRPIALAEARVLQNVAKSESPDWSDPTTQRELLGSSEAVQFAAASAALDTNLGAPLAMPRAIWGCKKDLLAVACSAAITGLCAWKVALAYRIHADGRAWMVFELAAWVSISAAAHLPSKGAFRVLTRRPNGAGLGARIGAR